MAVNNNLIQFSLNQPNRPQAGPANGDRIVLQPQPQEEGLRTLKVHGVNFKARLTQVGTNAPLKYSGMAVDAAGNPILDPVTHVQITKMEAVAQKIEAMLRVKYPTRADAQQIRAFRFEFERNPAVAGGNVFSCKNFSTRAVGSNEFKDHYVNWNYGVPFTAASQAMNDMNSLVSKCEDERIAEARNHPNPNPPAPNGQPPGHGSNPPASPANGQGRGGAHLELPSPPASPRGDAAEKQRRLIEEQQRLLDAAEVDG